MRWETPNGYAQSGPAGLTDEQLDTIRRLDAAINANSWAIPALLAEIDRLRAELARRDATIAQLMGFEDDGTTELYSNDN